MDAKDVQRVLRLRLRPIRQVLLAARVEDSLALLFPLLVECSEQLQLGNGNPDTTSEEGHWKESVPSL